MTLLILASVVNAGCGAVWGQVPLYSNPNSNLAGATYNGYVYSATGAGLSISFNEGQTWVTTTSGQNGFPASNNVTGIAANGTFVVAAATGGGIGISNNGGASWSTVTSGQNGFAATNNMYQA